MESVPISDQIPSPRIYWTEDAFDGRIDASARLRVAPDEETAKTRCIKRMQELVDPAYEFEAVIAKGCECVDRVKRDTSLGDLERLIADYGLMSEDVVLRYDHSGDPDEVWIAIRAPVFIAIETGRMLGSDE